jgi:hypothetical protein
VAQAVGSGARGARSGPFRPDLPQQLVFGAVATSGGCGGGSWLGLVQVLWGGTLFFATSSLTSLRVAHSAGDTGGLPPWPPRGFGEALFGATVVRSGSPVVVRGNNKWAAVAPAATVGFVCQGGGGSLLLSWGPCLALCWGFLGRKPWRRRRPWASLPLLRASCFPALHGRKPRPFRTGDGGVLDVTPFLKASLLLAGAGQRIKVLEVSLVKNRSCLEWGVSCLATTARRILSPPGSMFVVVVVFHLALCCLSWGVGAARHLC